MDQKEVRLQRKSVKKQRSSLRLVQISVPSVCTSSAIVSVCLSVYRYYFKCFVVCLSAKTKCAYLFRAYGKILIFIILHSKSAPIYVESSAYKFLVQYSITQNLIVGTSQYKFLRLSNRTISMYNNNKTTQIVYDYLDYASLI